MALIECPDCQAQISTAAPTCPRCGHPIPPPAQPPKPQPVIVTQLKRPALLATFSVLVVIVAVLIYVAGGMLIDAWRHAP